MKQCNMENEERSRLGTYTFVLIYLYSVFNICSTLLSVLLFNFYVLYLSYLLLLWPYYVNANLKEMIANLTKTAFFENKTPLFPFFSQKAPFIISQSAFCCTRILVASNLNFHLVPYLSATTILQVLLLLLVNLISKHSLSVYILSPDSSKLPQNNLALSEFIIVSRTHNYFSILIF